MNSKPTAAILIGLQGSGKSTFYQRFLSDMVHVNPDTLRTRHREAELIRVCIPEPLYIALEVIFGHGR